jgi:hypothetical protein
VPAAADPRRRGALAGRLIGAPARIRRAAIAAERAAPTPGQWSAQEIVLHLVAVESEVFQRRLRDLGEVESPDWTWVEPGPAPKADSETLAESLVRFSAARLATLDWVAGLDLFDWQRAGHHATLGVLDVAGLLELAADHDKQHLAALVRLGRVT